MTLGTADIKLTKLPEADYVIVGTHHFTNHYWQQEMNMEMLLQ